MGLFEQNPVVFFGIVIAIVEGWLHVRGPLFSMLGRRLRRGDSRSL